MDRKVSRTTEPRGILRVAYDEDWLRLCYFAGKVFDWQGAEVECLGKFAERDFADADELFPAYRIEGKRVRIVCGMFDGLAPVFGTSAGSVWKSDGRGAWVHCENDSAYQVVRLTSEPVSCSVSPADENDALRIIETIAGELRVERRVHIPYYSLEPVPLREKNYVRTAASKVWGLRDEWIFDPSAKVVS